MEGNNCKLEVEQRKKTFCSFHPISDNIKYVLDAFFFFYYQQCSVWVNCVAVNIAYLLRMNDCTVRILLEENKKMTL